MRRSGVHPGGWGSGLGDEVRASALRSSPRIDLAVCVFVGTGPWQTANMESDIYMFSVDQAKSAAMDPTSLEKLGLWETAHLERWVIDNSAVLGGDVKI